MTLGTAILLLAVAIIGIVLLSLIALVLAGYIGLTIFFVDAVSRQLPIS